MKFSSQTGTNLALGAGIVMLAAFSLVQYGEHQDEFALLGGLVASVLLVIGALGVILKPIEPQGLVDQIRAIWQRFSSSAPT